MKKKRVITIVILILVLSCIAGGVFVYTERKKKQEETLEKILIAIEYRRQNGTFPRTSGHYADEAFYVGYDAIRENEMYVSLAAYNEWNREHGKEAEELILADIEEYLSAEYNEDGSLRIQSGYENIRAYIEWYYDGGDEVIKEYWKKLEDIAIECRYQYHEFPLVTVKVFRIEQLQELIKKKEDPSYEINMEIMRDQQ